MKKIVAGMTNAFLRLTNSRNSGDLSTASQSMSGRCSAPSAPPTIPCVMVNSSSESGTLGCVPGARAAYAL